MLSSYKEYRVSLTSEVSKSFRCQKAANSLDINTEKKSRHDIKIRADIESDFNVGLILGSSGSGKTTLAQEIWGADCFFDDLEPGLPVLEQFPSELDYESCATLLSSVGLTSVPCWIRPAYTLSNGQKARATAALAMAKDLDPIVLDEWTSVVDRTVAKVMSHSIQKSARRRGSNVVLLSCHYDVIDWLQPDWIIDCNKQSFENRRGLRRERTEKLTFDIKRASRASWRYFSKYHYLSERLPGGRTETFGLFHNADQIGFCCFANYVPHDKKKR